MNTVEEELQQMQQQMQQMQIHFYNQQQQQTQNMQYLQYPTMGMAAGGLQGGTPYFHQQAQSSSIPQQQQPLYYQPPPQGVGFYPLNPPPLPMDSPCSLQLYNGQHHHNTLPHTLPHPAPPPRRSSIASSHESSNSATPSSSSQSQSTALFHNLNTHTTPHLLLQRPLSSVSVVSSSPSISTSSSSPAPAPAPGTAAAAAGHGLRRHPSPSHVPFAASTTVASSSSSLSSSSSSSTTTTVPSSITASLQDYRDVAKYSNDPAIHLDFAKLLIQSAEHLKDPNPKSYKKTLDLLHQEALKFLKRAASNPTNGADAQFFLAGCYGNGSIGLSVDHSKAFSLYIQSSKSGHPAASYRTAVCYEVGAGTKRDYTRALQFYRKAATLGDTAAMFKLGMILVNGGPLNAGAVNVREGLSWLKRSAAQADETTPHALHELAVLYEMDPNIPSGGRPAIESDIIMPDPAHAYDLYLRAAQLNYPPSQYKLGICYEYGLLNLPVNPRRSIAWYTRAALQGDAEAELALSGWYLTGAEGILQQSDTEAYLWARKAADKGLSKAEYAVGYYTENGVGMVQPSLDEARRWYLRAAGQGNKRAVQRLRDIKDILHAANRQHKQQQKQQHQDLRRGGQHNNADCVVM